MIQFSDVMESNESDARSVEYMQKMYKGCMNEGKENTITGIIGVQNKWFSNFASPYIKYFFIFP